MGTDNLTRLITLWQFALFFLADIIRVSCDGPIVQTDKGTVRGFSRMVNQKKVDMFFGIPYAVPPLDDLRYRPPVQNNPWEGVLDATQLPNSCYQSMDTYFKNFTGSTMWNANTPMSEDCLYLNVWVPRTNPPYKNKAVIVWIFGGGFYSGSSTLDIYQAEHLAAENDIIVVSMQYRVGHFGFLVLDTSEAPGNMGLWDQRMALEWVNRNIHNFGGNAHNVTLMGESAGAVSVGTFLLCDLCRGYFQRAILQSGSPSAQWAVLPKSRVMQRSLRFAAKVGCDTNMGHDHIIRCLRAKNDSQPLVNNEFSVVDGIMQFPFVPIVDGVFIRQTPRELLRQGNFKKVPLLLGSNTNEVTFFMVYESDIFLPLEEPPVFTPATFDALMRNRIFLFYPYNPKQLSHVGLEAVKFRYKNWLNPDSSESLWRSADAAASDCYFVCPVNHLARSYAAHDLPVYYYWFDQRWSANPWPGWMGVLHADEIWFTFGQAINKSLPFTDEERQLSRRMMTYWTNFAKTGDPNKAPGELSLMEWPRFRTNEQLYLNISVKSFASGNTIGQGPRTQHCAFWDEYLPKLLVETSNVTDVEREWKEQFHEWKTRYIVDWKTQFDNFLDNYQRRMGSCSGGKP